MAASPPPFASPEERLARIPDLVARGALDEAARLCAGVLDAAPGHPLAEYFAGLIAYERGSDPEAEDAYRKAILHARDPALRAAAWHGLARVDERRDDLPRATEDLEKALENDPQNPLHLRTLAEILLARHRHEEAERALRAALRIDASDAAAWGLLAEILVVRGRHGEALDALDASESRLGPEAPRFAESVGLRARIALIEGDLEEAERAYRRAVERDPTYPGYAPIAEIHRFRDPGDPLLAWLEERAETLGANAPAPVRADLAYALGKAREDLGQAERAFAAYAEGARLRRPARAAERVALQERRAALLRNGFGNDTFDALASSVRARLPIAAEDKDEGKDFVPVFIVGLPRGGSTLLEQALAAHPAVSTCGELPHGLRLAQALLAAWYARGSIPPEDPEAAARELADLAARYEHASVELLHGRPVLIDKALANYEHLGILAAAFPHAVFLHAYKEDALDQCWGIFRRNFGRGHDYSYDLSDLGRTWRTYRALMDHWRSILPPGRLLDVPYERFVERPEETLRTVLAALGLPFDPACLHPEKVARPVSTASLVQVREAIHRERVGSARPFLPWLGPLRQILESPETGEDALAP